MTHSALISLKIQLSGKNVLTSSSATMGSSGVGCVGGATISPSGPNNLKCKIHIIFLRSIMMLFSRIIHVHLGRILKQSTLGMYIHVYAVYSHKTHPSHAATCTCTLYNYTYVLGCNTKIDV